MKQLQKVTGNILLFYAYDIGDEINLGKVDSQGLISTYKISRSHYFKDYHIPLGFRLLEKKGGKTIERTDVVLTKMHHFGVLSFCYKIPFEASFDQLKQRVIEVKDAYDKQSDIDARMVLHDINPVVTKPHFYNLKNDYFAVHVNPIEGRLSADEFQEVYGGKIASLLRLELLSLSEYQQDDILSSVTGYYGQDFIIIDSEASFVYDDEYFEAMEFFESANVQQLELQYFDSLIDKRLNYFYQQEPHKIPLRAYVPFVGRRLELPASKLARLRVDISVITERLEYSIKMTGEAYYSKLYSMLVEKLFLREWRDSINRKLEIIGDLQRVHQDHLDTIHEDMLTLVIIILIALEVVLAIFGK